MNLRYIIKIRIIYFLPNAYKLKRVTVTQPIRDEEVPIFSTRHISKTDVVLTVYFCNINFVSFTVIFAIVLIALVFNCKGSYNSRDYNLFTELFTKIGCGNPMMGIDFSDNCCTFTSRRETELSKSRQNAANSTVAKSLPQKRVILPKSFV